MSDGSELEQVMGLPIYGDSAVRVGDTLYAMARPRAGGAKRLCVFGDDAGFQGKREAANGVLVCALSPANAAALRSRVQWLRPVPLGLQTSAGFGDRLGVATPGHVRATREAGVAPVFAQQSVRENERTGRSAQEVLDDAMWGVFQEGWREPWGADADHLKTPASLAAFVSAGYTLYTIDPGDHVDNEANRVAGQDVEAKVADLPWETLDDAPSGMEQRYLNRQFDLGDGAISLDSETLWRAAAKYGRAVAHTVAMYRCLVSELDDSAFELEISVDETDSPTSPEEHIFIATELQRLGVRWVSLAPRFIGRFEKGVDYIGDLGAFAAEFGRHAAVAEGLGPYKLSVHSGSDKFSIYPIVARYTRGLSHLKTAGTSYLEALRAAAVLEPALFRSIVEMARDRYEIDRATYHVSARPSKLPDLGTLRDAALPELLDQFDARQMLHVTFGSSLQAFGDRLLKALRRDEEVYYALLMSHFERHLASFAGVTRRARTA
jgi:hypothetical protein